MISLNTRLFCLFQLLAQVGVLKAKVDATGEELKKTRVFEFKCQVYACR